MPLKTAFETYLYSENLEGSKKAGSYLTALKHLQTMLRSEAYGFDDCIDLWSVQSVERIAELRERVLAEAKRGTDTPWYLPSMGSVNGVSPRNLTFPAPASLSPVPRQYPPLRLQPITSPCRQ